MTTQLNTVNIKDLYYRSPGTAYAKPPQRIVNIIDQFRNLASAGNALNDGNVSTYVLQQLAPNQVYKLSFQIQKETSFGSGVYTNVHTGSLKPAAMIGVDNTNTQTPGGFWWDAQDELLFQTTSYDLLANITPTGFGGVRQGATYNTPPVTAGYTTFRGQKTISIETNGQPLGGWGVGLDPSRVIQDTYDGYLFIFPRVAFAGDSNEYYTDQFLTNSFIGYDDTNSAKGYIFIEDIAINGSAIFSETDFTATNGAFYKYRSGAGLDRTLTYVAALMLVNRTSSYLVSTDSAGYRKIKWFTADIPVGGVWSISLGQYRNPSSISASLSTATSVAISVDGIGVAGTITDTDNFKLIITADPVVL